MVDVLGAAAALNDARGRYQWRRELSEAFDDLELDPYPTPRQEYIEAVRACGEHEGGLELLLDVTHFVAPAVSHRLRPLVDEWHSVDLYGDHGWSALRAALDIGLPELPALVAEVCGDRYRLPTHCATAWHAFVHLACRNAPPDGLPPSMALLEHLAVHADLASAVGELRAWNDRHAESWGLREGPNGLLALRAALSRPRGPGRAESAGPSAGTADGAPRGGVDPARSTDPAVDAGGQPVIRVYIKVAPDLTPADSGTRRQGRREQRYRLSTRVKYVESAQLHQESGGEPPDSVPRNRLPAAVAQVLTSMSELWRSRAEGVVLDFFLPNELLNEPVEWYDRNPRLGYANPLLSKYPEIVLHSLERVQRRSLHHAWRMRWARWQSRPGGGEVHWCDPEGRRPEEHLALLDARIGKQEDIAGMVLSEPPQPRGGLGLRELGLGLDLGVPVLIHHRQDSGSAQFRSLVREALTVTDEGLSKLPVRAREWKCDSAAGGIDSPESAVIKNLSIIWDDPAHLLDGPSAPATFVGGFD
ncbi:hypothetical protein LRS74_06440 [Streptomyces sp. LX-29]|uniref:VMAP-C domain-containing protein n=1 Tax=Streptomyces sp. LX-29 TaxID=2900152 RepID=UPI00240E3429|nr:hypothetical protein [Streptomyces sp. LX-29]WFB06722.1 hypothetical protein LRS74_06440 [Streptomyces sp. LX-29]